MSRDNLMGQYSIKQLEKISGVKAHTIRIWESRYNILVPNRTSTNIRYYNDEQLKKLLNISLLINKGSKISKLSNLTEKEIHSKVEEHLISPLNSETVSDERINALFISMIDFDEVYFDKIFSDSVLQIGFSKTIINLIYPFLAKVGLMWGISEISPAQEHFISNLIRQKVIIATVSIKPLKDIKNTYLLFLPEGELHEIGLLVAYYIIKSKGNKVIYLGQNVPFKDVLETYKECKCNNLFTIITNQEVYVDSAEEYLKRLNRETKKARLLISTAKHLAGSINFDSDVINVNGIDHLEALV